MKGRRWIWIASSSAVLVVSLVFAAARSFAGASALSAAQLAPGPINTTINPPVAKLQPAGVPKVPVLQVPATNAVLPGPTMTFSWVIGSGELAQTTYQICVVERDKPCSDADAAKFGPFPTGTATASPGLPIRFMGKALSWTVTACAPNSNIRVIAGSGPAISCSSATPRALTWILPAPQITRPNGPEQSLRPNFVWTSVTNAESYLLCVSKPGVACPFEPTSNPNTFVVSVAPPVTIYTPPTQQELVRFGGQTVHWTAAACSSGSGCVYQQNVKAVGLPAPIQAPPIAAPPQLVSPASGAILAGRQHTFEWRPVSDAFTYKLCIAPPGVACGTNGALETPNLATTRAAGHLPAWMWPAGSPPREFHWTVAACNRANQCLYQQAVRAFTASEGVEKTFKVLSYNTYMRPDDLRFPNGQSQRVNLLPAHLSGYDAIIFSELFDDSIRERLLTALRPEYPNQTRVVGTDRGVEQDGGVVIVSKLAMQPAGGEELRFADVCSNDGAFLDDCQADKGAMYVKLSTQDGRALHLMGTHTQAGHTRERVGVRGRQLMMIKNFIDAKRIPACEPVLIGGDFNVQRYAPSGGLTGEWRVTLANMNVSEPAALTYYQWANQTYNCTYCHGLNPLADDDEEGAQHLDYVVYSNAHLAPRSASLRVLRPMSPVNWGRHNGYGVNDLSDHFPIAAEYKFMYPTGLTCR